MDTKLVYKRLVVVLQVNRNECFNQSSGNVSSATFVNVP